MAQLTWDEIGKKYFQTGVHQVALFVFDSTAEKYGKGIAWSGITNITEKASGGDETKLWADNIQYGSMRSAEEYGLSIEGYMYPDEFSECDGSKQVKPGVFIGQQARKTFALAWLTNIGSDTVDPSDADAPFYLHIAYGLSASPSERASNTINDNPTAETMSWDASSVPVNVSPVGGVKYKPCSSFTLDSRTADAAKLAALMEKLFGSATADAELAMPDDVIAAM